MKVNIKEERKELFNSFKIEFEVESQEELDIWTTLFNYNFFKKLLNNNDDSEIWDNLDTKGGDSEYGNNSLLNEITKVL